VQMTPLLKLSPGPWLAPASSVVSANEDTVGLARLVPTLVAFASTVGRAGKPITVEAELVDGAVTMLELV